MKKILLLTLLLSTLSLHAQRNRNNTDFSGYSVGVQGFLLPSWSQPGLDYWLGLNATYTFNNRRALSLALRHSYENFALDDRSWERQRRQTFLGTVYNRHWWWQNWVWENSRLYIFTNIGFGALWSTGQERRNFDPWGNPLGYDVYYNFNGVSGGLYGATGLGFNWNQSFSIQLGVKGAIPIIGNLQSSNDPMFFLGANYYFNQNRRSSRGRRW
ncbi:MAG: hypothetical protein FWD02_04715 [Bacteroidales bacterium]|nr:hypothetical protein [Bacteroidales bacterium]